jgi:hypothetical protein
MKLLNILIAGLSLAIIFFLYLMFAKATFDEPALYNVPSTTNGNIDPSDLAFSDDYGGWWWDYPWMWSSYPIYEYWYYPYIWGDRYYRGSGDRYWNRPRGHHPRPQRPLIRGAPRSMGPSGGSAPRPIGPSGNGRAHPGLH